MPESWSFTQQGAGGGGGEISPGSGSSGFSSRALVFGNALGQLVNAGAPQWDSTQGFLGIGTTDPLAPLDVASTAGVVVSTGSQNGYMFRNSISGFRAPTTATVVGTISNLAKIQLDANGFKAVSTVNGNSFQVFGTTVQTTNIVINVETSGAVAKLAFWSTAGTTQPASYTTGTATTVRTLPSTITTVAGLMSAPEREEFNEAVGALNCLILDLKAYGLLK